MAALPRPSTLAVLALALVLLCGNVYAQAPPPVCTDSNCMECYEEAPESCKKCNDGYFSVDEGGKGICYLPAKCSVTIADCDGCIGKNRDKCGRCTPGYEVHDFKCRAPCDAAACATCKSATDRNRCGSCNPGYNLVTVGAVTVCLTQGTCAPTAVNCAVCPPTDPTKCTKCQDGYGLVNGECIVCNAPNCLRCQDGSTTQCAENGCIKEYIMESGKCTLFCQVTNCAICADGDRNTCNNCEENYKLKNTDNGLKCVSSAEHVRAVAAFVVACAVVALSL